jgi:hypothetical protein
MCARTLLSVIGEADVPGDAAGGRVSAHALITHVSPMMVRAFDLTREYYLGCIARRSSLFAYDPVIDFDSMGNAGGDEDVLYRQHATC